MNLKNNVYVRSNRSIKTISITRICLLIPLIIFGLYKNGISLYREGYISFIEIFRPLIYIMIGALSGIVVNILYQKVIKKSNDDIISVIFSSFHMEYGIILGMLTSINTNIILFTLVVFVGFFISKFLHHRVNLMCLIMIIIYLITQLVLGGYSYLNISETSGHFSYEFMDYLVGKHPGGIASTHIILIILTSLALHMTNNNKTLISLSSIVTLLIVIGLYSLLTNANFSQILFSNNIIMLMCFVANDYQTSSYTQRGMIVFGILIGILTFLLTFLNAYLAPLISILIVSLFNNLIDRKCNILLYK